MAGLRPTIAGLFPAPLPAIPALGGLADAIAGTSRAGGIGSFKNWFFDREAVTNRLPALKRKVLSRFGAIVMREARQSIRTRAGASAPGTPPNSHRSYPVVSKKTGRNKKHYSFRDSILFAYDPYHETVVVGPYKFGGTRTAPTVPELHEFGGTVPGNGRVAWILNAVGRDARGRYESNGYTRVVLTGPVRYPARPYMRPALKRISTKFAGLFRDSL